MKKIVFCNMVVSNKPSPLKYETDNKDLAYDKPVMFYINGVLANKLHNDDDVKVVLLLNETALANSLDHVRKYEAELNEINQNIGAKIEYKTITAPREEIRQNQADLFKNIINEIDDNSQIYADITFGTKSMPIILFSALQFADKAFNADIKNIIYGSAEFKDNKAVGVKLYEVTSLFYLSAISSKIEYKNTKNAKEILNALFEI
jgi:hypothetical protein